VTGEALLAVAAAASSQDMHTCSQHMHDWMTDHWFNKHTQEAFQCPHTCTMSTGSHCDLNEDAATCCCPCRLRLK
jgi:hypothetical protein